MLRACNIQTTYFHHKTSLSPTILSIPLQSLMSPAAQVPPLSLPGTSLPPSLSHLWFSRPSPLSHSFLLTPVRRSSPPDDLHGSISQQTRSICLGRPRKFKILANPVATPPVAVSPPLHWPHQPLLQGSTTPSCRVLLLFNNTATTGTPASADSSLCCVLLLMVAGSLLCLMWTCSYIISPPITALAKTTVIITLPTSFSLPTKTQLYTPTQLVSPPSLIRSTQTTFSA